MADTLTELGIESATVSNLMSPVLLNKQVWDDLANAFNAILEANVDDPIKQLETIRFLPPDADPKVLADTCRMLGFDLSQDVLNLSVNSFTKIATQLGRYPDNNGTENFTRFISLLINGFCDVEYLWSKDYVNFYTSPLGATLEEGGPWFKTTHVELAMGFISIAGLQLKAGQSLYQKTKEIFYQQAPATLVIDRTFFAAYVDTKLGVAATLMNNRERVFHL